MAGFVNSGRVPIWSNMFSWLSPLVIGIKGTASGLNGSGDVRMGGVNTCELTPLSFQAQNTGVAIRNYNCGLGPLEMNTFIPNVNAKKL